MEKISFETENGTVELFVLGQTTLSGETFLLVAESEEDDCDAMILRQVDSSDGDDAVYEEVDDEKQLDALAKVFTEILEDVEFS